MTASAVAVIDVLKAGCSLWRCMVSSLGEKTVKGTIKKFSGIPILARKGQMHQYNFPKHPN